MNDNPGSKSYSQRKKQALEIETMLKSGVPLSVIAKTMNIKISDILKHQEQVHHDSKT